MTIRKSLGTSIKIIRNVKNLTQEDFSEISSRTYISTLERGLYCPTLEKIEDLAMVMGVHPLTLITLSYLVERNESEPFKLFNEVTEELSIFNK